jgi:regulator of sirC expression with transglutaminase-like and TPR domain
MPGVSREELQDALAVVVVKLAERVGMPLDYVNEPELFSLWRLVEDRRLAAEYDAARGERELFESNGRHRQIAQEWQANEAEKVRIAAAMASSPRTPGAGKRLVRRGSR